MLKKKHLMCMPFILVFFLLIVFRLAAFFRESNHSQKPFSNQSHYIQLTDVSIRYQHLQTDNKQKNIVLIHGTGAWSMFWFKTSAFLNGLGYNVYAIDLPPFGFSKPSNSYNYSDSQQAKTILEFIRTLKIKNPVMLAHSFGAAPAMEAVFQNEAIFERVILISAALGLQSEANHSLPVVLKSRLFNEFIISATAANPLLIKAFLKSMLHQKQAANKVYVDILKKPFSRNNMVSSVSRWLPNLFLTDPQALNADIQSYQKLKLDVDIIWGNKDTLTSINQAHHLKQTIKQANVFVLDNVGHIPHIEKSDEVHSILKKILRQ